MTNQPEYDFRPGPLPLLIAAHRATIQRKGVQIDSQELAAILDDFVRELNTIVSHSPTYFNSLNEIILSLNAIVPPALVSLTSNYFFVIVRNSIQVLLQELYTKFQLNELATYVLRNCVLLLEHVVTEIGDVSKLLHWITDLTFMDTLGNCLHHIERIAKVAESRRFLKQISRLLDTFIIIQERLPADEHNSMFARLLEPVMKCLTSATYVHTFKDLKSSSRVLNPYQKLLLTGCPHFITCYNGPHIERTIEQVLEVMLPRYVTVLDTHIKTIKKWHRPLKLSIYHLLTVLVFAEGYFTSYLSSQLLQTLTNHLLRLINESTLIDHIHAVPDNSESLLIDAALQVIHVLVQEPDALEYMKQCKPTMTFRRLLSTPCETISSNTYTLLAYTMIEDDIKHLHGYLSSLLFTILNTLYHATQPPDPKEKESETGPEKTIRNITQLTETLTGLVRHEQVKHELLKQNALPFLVDCAHKLAGPSRHFILESLWTLALDNHIAQQLRDNSHFIQSLHNILKTSAHPHNGVHRSANPSQDDLVSWNEATDDRITEMATGLLWALLKESQWREKASKAAEQSKKYDVTVSYSVKDKDAVDKLEEALVNGGYSVWLDRDMARRQSLESVSEAMGKSSVVVVCLSSWYERDNRSVSECVYAMKSESPVVGVVVEKGYAVDGWVMSMVDKNALIELDTNDGKRSTPLLLKAIERHCKKHIPKPKAPVRKSKLTEQNVLRFSADLIDKPIEPKVERSTSRSLTPPRKPVLVDKEQQLSWRPNSRGTLLGMTPISQTPLLVNQNYQKYLPQEYTKRDTKDATYHATPVNAWKKKEIMDFLYDNNLNLMMPLCESMTGRALLRFYRMCQRKPSRVHAQLNEELRSRFRGLTLPMGVYTQFLIEVDNVLDSTSEPSQIVTPTSAKNIPQVAFMPIATPEQSSARQFNLVPTVPPILPPAPSANNKPTRNSPTKNALHNARVIERAIFRPASTADRPYDFIVETGEESTLLFQQVERYAPQLYLLQQQARERRDNSGSRSG